MCKVLVNPDCPVAILDTAAQSMALKATSPPIDLTITTKPDNQESNHQTSETNNRSKEKEELLWFSCDEKALGHFLVYGHCLDDDIIDINSVYVPVAAPRSGRPTIYNTIWAVCHEATNRRVCASPAH